MRMLSTAAEVPSLCPRRRELAPLKVRGRRASGSTAGVAGNRKRPRPVFRSAR
jgi:hypothetical protein